MRASANLGPVEVALGHKFGVLAVSDPRGGGLDRPLLDLQHGLAASSALPGKALETWADNIGRFHVDRGGGTVQLFKRAAADASFIVISVLDKADETLEDDDLDRADFVLYVGNR